ncbi:MAG: adenylate/guanylate cyclase domain-containing protein [Geminicoccaceae bacterium]
MSDKRIQRRLAAILAADVVGFSGLMEQDEAGTLEALKSRRTQVLDPLVASHRGRVFKLLGDGVLIEFASAVDAVQCAIRLQAAMAAANSGPATRRRITLRIGINIGDVIVEGRDLYGDCVNVATRLEGIAEPGGICLSHAVHQQVRRKLDCEFEDLGLHPVKNILEPIHVHRVVSAISAVGDPDAPLPLRLPAKPSIAVLPFTNLSQDLAQEPFTDGLTEDLITELSRHAGLFVIARHSSFTYKGRSLDARQIASELGVRYLLEGSARRSADKVRVNVKLIDAIGGVSLWAERFDRGLDDVFAVQDEVTGKIVEAMIGRLDGAPPPRKRPRSLEAYELCVRGRTLAGRSPESGREAVLLLRQAIAREPDYAEAHRWLALHLWAAWVQWGEPEEPNRRLAVAAAERAVALDPNDAGCHWMLGHVLGYERRFAASDEAFALALQLDPNDADAWAITGAVAVYRGDPTAGIAHIERALRLNPHPPSWYFHELGLAQYSARRYDAAVSSLRQEGTYRTVSRRILAASLAQLGRTDDARQEAALFMAANPSFTIAAWAAHEPSRDQATLDHLVEGYRMAGLPD